jgi:hypothetical protein
MSAALSAGSEQEFTRAKVLQALRAADARDVGLDATAAHVLEKLIVFANGEGEAFVSVDRIAACDQPQPEDGAARA